MVQLVVREPQLCIMESCITGALGGHGSDQFIKEEIKLISKDRRKCSTPLATK